ncbi:hypothetical protein GCM10028806_53150 [Spirosoma terrae]
MTGFTGLTGFIDRNRKNNPENPVNPVKKNWSIIVIRNSEKSLQAIRHEKDFAPTCFTGWVVCL